MKVVCDNCRAVYKVPDEKLVKPVNKATCRQCGHRMLIPRPRPDADPNEKTLVTAVPPTPVGAPPRVGERKTTPIVDEEPEKTLPGASLANDEVQVFPGTPMPAGPRKSAPAVTHGIVENTVENEPEPGDEDDFREVATVVRAQPSPMSSRPATPVPPAPAPPPRSKKTPPPVPKRATPIPQQSRATPAPAPMRAHDPSGDLTWALLGSIGAVVGAFILAFLSVVTHQAFQLALEFLGLAIAMGGALTAFLILFTSSRGRKPARVILSLFLGAIVALGFSTVLVGLHYTTNQLIAQAENLEFGAPSLAELTEANPELAEAAPEPGDEGTPEAAAAGTDADDAPTDEAPPEDDTPEPKSPATPTGAGAAAAPPPKPAAPKPAPAAPPPKPAPSSPAPSSPAPTPPPAAPAPKPTPPPPPAEPQAKGVPMQVIDVMLRNNQGVKVCFAQHANATGSLPKRVDVRFTLLRSGKATGVSVAQSELRGTSFESCMAGAVASIGFPPSGRDQTINYPFNLSR